MARHRARRPTLADRLDRTAHRLEHFGDRLRLVWASRHRWHHGELKILGGGLAIAIVLVLIGAFLPAPTPSAASSAPPVPVATLIKLVAAQASAGPTPAQRDRAAAMAWLAAMQQMQQLTAADHLSATIVTAAPTVLVTPIGRLLPGQAGIDVAAARALLNSLPNSMGLLAKASLIKNNDRIGNRDDEWSRADRRVVDGSPRATAVELLASFGFGLDQWGCLDRMWWQESNWNPTDATGQTYGIPQALPGSKMAAAGPDWRTNPTTQIRWGLAYIAATYGSPCQAWTFWSQHYWY